MSLRRRGLWITLLVAATTVPSSAPAMGSELLVNGSFEKRGSGTGKSPFAGWTGREWDGGTYRFEVGRGRDGKTCALITCVEQGRGGIGQIEGVKLEAKTRYFFSMWVKAKGTDGGPCFVNFWSPDAGDITRLTLPGGTHEWMHVTRVFAPPKACTLNLYIHNKSLGTLLLDDVSLRALDKGEAPPAGEGRKREPYRDLPAGADYALGAALPCVRVFEDETFPDKPSTACALSAARDEAEGFQLVILHPRKDLKNVRVTVSPLANKEAKSVIGKANITVSPVAAINIRVPSERMYIRRFGPWPEVLLPDGPFDVKKDGVRSVFIDVKVPRDAAPGLYSGTVTVTPANARPQTLALTLRVRRFAIPWGREAHLRNISFMGGGWQSVGGKLEDYEAMALSHRLGVGGFAVSGTSGFAVHNMFRNWGGDGPKYRFDEIEPKLDRLMAGGMNAFMTAVIPNLRRAKKDVYPQGYCATLGGFARAYHDFAKSRGWGDCAFVYGYDEVPPKHFGLAKEAYAAVKKACPEARVILCLNEPEAVTAMAGHTDVYLLYIHNHLRSRVDTLKKPNERVWWSYGCIYPSARPNQFLVYPPIDVRVLPWIAHKYGIEGLSVWGLTYYHASNHGRTFPTDAWVPTSAAPGDGCMIYPGPGGRPLPSLRLKAVRDGLEDHEYLVLLARRAKSGSAEAKRLLDEIHAAIRQPTVYPDDPQRLMRWRERIAEVLEKET